MILRDNVPRFFTSEHAARFPPIASLSIDRFAGGIVQISQSASESSSSPEKKISTFLFERPKYFSFPVDVPCGDAIL